MKATLLIKNVSLNDEKCMYEEKSGLGSFCLGER